MCAGMKGPEMDIYICLCVLLQETNHVKRVMKSLIVGTTSLYIGRVRNCATDLFSYTICWYLFGWETLERACILHLAYPSCWSFCCFRLRFIKKIIWTAMFLLCVLQKKIIYVALPSLNLFLLKTVTYVSAMCSYRWLASRTWLWTLRVGAL